jgi:hypothetical protein
VSRNRGPRNKLGLADGLAAAKRPWASKRYAKLEESPPGHYLNSREGLVNPKGSTMPTTRLARRAKRRRRMRLRKLRGWH